MLIGRPVMVSRIAGAVHVTTEGRAFPVLPCRGLAELEASLEIYQLSFFQITAQFTAYRGINHLLIRRAERLPPTMIANTIGEDIRDAMDAAELALGVEGACKKLGEIPSRSDEAMVRGSAAVGRLIRPTDRYWDAGAAADVRGHLLAGRPDAAEFFRNDPTKAKLLPRVADISVVAKVEFQAAPRVPGAAELAGRGLPAEVGRTNLREEGSLVVGRSGRPVRQADGLLFYYDTGETPILLLPSAQLEEADTLTEFTRRRVKLRISGELTQYGGRNFLLLSRVVREPYDVSELK